MKYCDCCQMRLPDSWTLPTDSEHLKEILRLRAELAECRAALELIAAPQRSDGSWNRDREACRQVAQAALAAKGEE